jgi:polar amino acid transport system substrate-binding protein
MIYLQDNNIRPVTFDTIENGLMAVGNEEIDAFVHDAPIIRYYSRSDFQSRVRVLPNTFNDQYYGIALPLNSEYRNDINRVLLEFIQSDRWEELNRRYMGER